MIVIDTHILVWAMQDDPRLGAQARRVIDEITEKSRILISAITPWEIAMLVQKGRLALGDDVGRWIDSALALPGLDLAPIEPSIAVDSVRLPGAFHADPADRLIVATARHHRVPLMTADQAILGYGARGHLQVLSAD
ncbi:PilT domain-containing protein [Rhizobium phaseoli]|uniref:Ribonuclease VapC n=1 Tax=Rhizobium phaseoli TaxID=396 RepID=A0A192TEL4_9HYPH|nr:MULTISPECIES: type II toxin-antitoxin system VapC family toxin [Rhizobium]MDH6646555.1 PIN domain nuclease of toxin-antitoxin system [Rhizobium esperanzae]ANL29108.1 PilT domain-containing protein [Rhizobium phaseoli]ANL41674.1 PilT domain-containing protein [Rhizobium phaseoli]ANL54384.1 PilT domain-containing protein [Rhizobium phaseoli]ANL60661.1 PilT domain-containing protein [Rhizobium phaseoli]